MSAVSIALELIGNGPPPSGVMPYTLSYRATQAPSAGQRVSHGQPLLLWLSFSQGIMPPPATSFASICASLLVAPGVEILMMTTSIASFKCPQFEYMRQALATEIEQATHGQSRWSWDYLLCDGKPYLAKFLQRVHMTTVLQAEEEDSEDIVHVT